MQVFDVFRDNQVSVDVVATSEISVSLTLDQRWETACFKCYYPHLLLISRA